MIAEGEREQGAPHCSASVKGLRILLVDDHPMHRRGMRALLSTLPGAEVVAEATTGEDAILLAEELQPDVIIMDLQLPGMSGGEATYRIKQRNPRIGILVMTMFLDDCSVYGAIRAGAQGYILKDADEDEILRAVCAVGHGEAIFSPGTASRLLNRLIATIPPTPAEVLAGAPDTLPPSAILTFMVTDVRGYTRFTQERGDEAAARLSTRLAELTEQVVRSWNGRVVETRGDEVLVAFSSARGALQAAVALQTRLTSARVADPFLPLEVGVGLDAGEAVPVGDGYRGGSLNLAARLCSIAGPGEVFCTEAVMHLARKTPGISASARGEVILKGLSAPVRVIQVEAEAVPPNPMSRCTTAFGTPIGSAAS